MYNFCDPFLKSTIECDCVCADNHGVENLLLLEGNGFLSDYFIKPPVTITVRFICPVDLQHIVIWPSVNSQVSKGIEICSLFHQPGKCTPAFLAKAENFDPYGSIVFSSKIRNDVFKLLASSSFIRFQFRSKHYNGVVGIRVKIFRATHVAAIKKLQIWGTINQNSPLDMIRQVEELWSLSRKKLQELATKRPRSRTNEPDLKRKDSQDQGLIVPEEFLDKITNEIMTMPMTLPSGSVVDKETIERYNREQQLLGHLPNDPFTGVVYTSTKKPVVAGSLKSQIDAFMLKHANEKEIKAVPRVVGSSSKSDNNFRISSLVHRNYANERDEHKKTHLPCQTSNAKRMKTEHSGIAHNNVKIKKNFSDDSLDDLLKNTLSNLPCFTKVPVQKNKTTEAPECSVCGKSETLYNLACEHIMCRPCLLVENAHVSNCKVCGKKYGSNDIKRIHDISKT